MSEVQAKPDIIKIAKSRRHLKMMEDLQQGKTLSLSQIKELAEYEGGEGSNPGILATQKQVASVFRVDERTVRNWIEAGMPVKEGGKYDLAEIVAWKSMRDQPTSPAALSAKIEELKLRMAGYKVDLVEAKVNEVKGRYFPREEVERGLVQVSIAIKRALLALPRAIAPRLVGLEPREIEAVLRERVEEIINLFAKELIFEEPGKRGKKKSRQAKDMDS
jgi:phage terminase Nu1 subunit (DNA packaging protein)